MLDVRVKDWSTDHAGPPSERSFRSLTISALRLTLVFAAVWLLLFATKSALPFVENGASAVAHVKYQIAGGPNLFSPTSEIRVVAFGNSKTLAGFEPLIFTSFFGPRCSAFNLAIPGDDRFVDLLEIALAHGNSPTHVFVQQLPNLKGRSDSLWSTLLDNKKMVNLVFPFRGYVRDAFLFAFEARGAGGLIQQYKSNTAQITNMRNDLGYYFIKSQSHYPGDRLPDDYSLPSDRPNDVMKRLVNVSDPGFRKLMQLSEKYGFQVVNVPVVFRRGEFAAPPDVDRDSVQLLAPYPRVRVLGPAYWLYEPKEFSDPVHLNPEGAARYTMELAALFQHSF